MVLVRQKFRTERRRKFVERDASGSYCLRFLRKRKEREKLKMTKRYQRKEEIVFPCQTLKSQVKPKDDLGNCFRKENSKPVGRLLLITVSYKSISCSKQFFLFFSYFFFQIIAVKNLNSVLSLLRKKNSSQFSFFFWENSVVSILFL